MSDAQDPRHASGDRTIFPDDRRAPKVQDLVDRVQPKTSPQAPETKPETVNHPSHYGGDGNPYEVWKVLRAWGLEKDALLWTAGKYLGRVGKKPGADILEELRKMSWYLTKRIKSIEEERGKKAEKTFVYALEIEGTSPCDQQPVLLFETRDAAISYADMIECPWGGAWKKDASSTDDCVSWSMEDLTKSACWAAKSVTKTEVRDK